MQRLEHKPAGLTNGRFVEVTSVTNARSFDGERVQVVPSRSSTNEGFRAESCTNNASYILLFTLE